jgi:serine/threonine-protein kinase
LQRALSASGRQFAGKLVIVADDSYHLSTVGNSLANLVSGTTYHKPGWSRWLTLGGAALVLLYGLLVLPRVSRSSAYLLSFILLLMGLISQYVLLIVQGVWAPLLGLFLYLLFAHFIMHLKRINDVRLDHLQLMAHEAFWHLGEYQYDQGDHEKALPNLLKCKPTSDVLDLLYEIALGFERRRQYDRALNLYSDIDVRRDNYRDVRKRIQSLTSVATQVVGDVFKPGQTSRTLVLPDLDIELPTLGRYELEKELGRGAMGVVYLGKDPKINRLVAIKTLDYSQFSSKEIKSIKSRFFREAEAAGRLSHPNIVTVYDVGDEEDFAFIAMDYVPGVSLGEFTQADKLLPVAEVYRLIAEVAETLDYAHSQNIVHRDIKPSNIMYNPDTGQFKVTDFGIARITDSVRTRTGSFMGSPSYMSPEQMTGSRVDGASDIYALGVSFYQLLTGALPFKADNLGNLAYKITHEKHKSIRDHRSDLPSSATRIVNKCLQKKPENRFKNGHEMAVALQRGMPRAC